jgi:hypothetical protein
VAGADLLVTYIEAMPIKASAVTEIEMTAQA